MCWQQSVNACLSRVRVWRGRGNSQYNELLGKGSFKRVYRGWDRVTGREVAWCSIRASTLTKQQLGNIVQEAVTLRMLTRDEGETEQESRRLLRFYDSFYLAPNAVFITELFEGGNLLEYVAQPCVPVAGGRRACCDTRGPPTTLPPCTGFVGSGPSTCIK